MPRTPRPGPGAPPLESHIAELRALAHPLRLRLLELFAETPRTTKQVAALLGAPPTRLYHHVAALERAGLLQVHATRKVRGTTERAYTAARKSYGMDPSGAMSSLTTAPPAKGAKGAKGKGVQKDDSAKRGPVRAVALTVLEQARREIAAAPRGAVEDAPLIARMMVNVPHARIPELRKRIYEAVRDTVQDCATSGGISNDVTPRDDDVARWALTLAFAPVWPRVRHAESE